MGKKSVLKEGFEKNCRMEGGHLHAPSLWETLLTAKVIPGTSMSKLEYYCVHFDICSPIS